MSAKRILITGAAGFVGAHLAARLAADGHEIHALVHPNTDQWRLTATGLDLARHDADLADASRVQRVVAAVRPEWVFHLAAHGAYAWHDNGRRIIETNVAGTMHLVDACGQAGFDAFVHAGSSSEYGIKDHPASEDELPEPNSLYAITKLAATQYCALAGRTRGLPVVTLRLYSVYGPLEEPPRLMPSLVLHALRGAYPPLADPESAHDFVYVDDVVDALVAAARHAAGAGGAIYNVACGVSTPLRELVEVIGTTLGVNAEPQWDTFPARPWDTRVWAGDASRIRERFGWVPRYALADGVRQMADWFAASPAMQTRYFEIERRRARAASA